MFGSDWEVEGPTLPMGYFFSAHSFQLVVEDEIWMQQKFNDVAADPSPPADPHPCRFFPS